MPESLAFRPTRLPAVLAVVYTALACLGCASLNRNPIPENVIEARQISLRGIEAAEQGRWDEAEGLFVQAIETHPTDERTHRRYAELLWRRGATDKAVSHLEKSVQLSGGDPQLRVQLGQMYLELGERQRAWQQAEAAVAAQRQLASAWALRGDILRRRGRLDEAMVNYHRALSYQPQYPHVQLAAAEVYRQQNRPRRALATLEVLADQYPPSEVPQDVLFLQGLALKALERYEDAVDVLAIASRRDDPALDVLYHLSEAQLLVGDIGNAKLAARAALARAPDHQTLRDLNDRIDQQQRRLTAGVDRF